MNRRKLALAGVVAVVGLLGFATVGLAFAQTGGDGPTPSPTVSPMGPGGHMGNFGAMQSYMGQTHSEVQAAVAKVLGLTVDELNAELNAGKTLPDIATEKGVEWSKVVDAMQAAHPDGYGPGMMGGAAAGGCPGHTAATPAAS